MATTRQKRTKRERVGSTERDAKHSTGAGWTSIRIPENVEIWKPKAGNHRIDIIPYEVGEGNPYATRPGTWYYERTYYRHNSIGANNESYTCPAKTAGMRCPICDHRAKITRDPDGDEKVVKALAPKQRQLWLIYDHDEPDKGVQLWEFSFWNFGNMLDDCRQMADEDEDHKSNFDDPDGGSTLKVAFKEVSGGSYKWIEAAVIEFKPRKNGLDDKLLDHGVCLDDLPKIEEYDKLKAILFQTEEGESGNGDGKDEESERKTRTRRSKPKDPTADEHGIERDMEVEHNGETMRVVKISGDGTALTLMDADDDVHKAVSPADVRILNNEDAPAAPPDDEVPFDDDDPPEQQPDGGGDDDWDEEWK